LCEGALSLVHAESLYLGQSYNLDLSDNMLATHYDVIVAQCTCVLYNAFARISTMQKRAFAVAGLSILNGLPLPIHLLLRTFSQAFLTQLKVALFGCAGVGSASE